MTWLFEEPEGIEFEQLLDNEKYDYALGQSKRIDKDWRWCDVWRDIAWSHSKLDYFTFLRNEKRG